MKIGFDVAQTCIEKAGCGYYADSLAQALAKGFPQHELVLYHHFGRWNNESTDLGTKIESKSVTEPLRNWSKQEAADFWSAPSIDPHILGNPDVIVGNCFQMPKVQGAKSVFTVYDTSFWTHPNFHTEPNRLVCQEGLLEAIRNADAFSFISQHSKSDFERIFPNWLTKQKKDSAVTPLAARNLRRKDIKKNFPKRDYWLFVGSLEPRKNVETLLDAYEIYASQNNKAMPLKLAGGAGWKSEETKQRIDRLSQSLPIEHLGYVSDEVLEYLYGNAFAFIFPSWYEGFGLPVIEAMNQGTPIITTLESSLKEIANGYSLNFNPSDANDLAQKMLSLENDPIGWKDLRQKSLERASSYNWDYTATMLIQLLSKILK